MQLVDNLVELGKRLQNSPQLEELMFRAEAKNPWFAKEFVQYATDAIAKDMLRREALEQWLGGYQMKQVDKTIGLIFAGNVPLVGFHDFICCYLSGCKMKIKLSGKDDLLFPAVLRMLQEIDPQLSERVELVEQLKDYEAIIATGSDNTNRYFEYYFRHVPKILRRSRNSIAILTGDETPEQLQALADDIFLYFGFGCRNVSKIYVPTGYDFNGFFPQMAKYAWLHNHNKYMNNYDYNRTIMLLNKTTHLANEFIMIVESPSIPSAIATLNFEYWHDENVLNTHLKQNADKIQCVVSGHPELWDVESKTYFGVAQHPQLRDYADGVDTMAFLFGL